jgi:membrane dipeptidase
VVIDGHNDLPWAMRRIFDGDLDAADLAGFVPGVHTDIPRLRSGGVSGQFWSVYVPSTLPGPIAVTDTLQQIDFVHRMIDRYPDDLALALDVDDVESAADTGRIASMLGMEGGHSINESLSVLRMMFDLGVRYMTLTHNHNVSWADSATDAPALGGMNDFGREVIREMNRIGMIVDLSHVSTDVMHQALRASTRPVMFSHSSARALCDVQRNVPDDVLGDLATNGGICMVAFVPDFVSPTFARWFDECQEMVEAEGGDPRLSADVDRVIERRTLTDPPPYVSADDIADHIEHVRDVAGIDHVGIGGDYGGSTLMPHDLHDVSTYPVLFAALIARGWSVADLDRLRRTNILRVMGDNKAAPHP